MKNRWNSEEAGELNSVMDLRVYTSRLIGQEPNLVLHGGGNTSVKMGGMLYVKGSGCDLENITADYFPSLFLDKLEKMRDLEVLGDEKMVELVDACKERKDSPRPSVEALLHAFLPSRFIDHTHADAVLTLTNQEHSDEILKEVYGDGEDVVYVPYVMPGFELAKAVADAVDKKPESEFAILKNHGVFTWGDRPEESYHKMIEVASKAEDYIKSKGGVVQSGDPFEIGFGEKVGAIRELLPSVRGALSDKKILNYDCSEEVLSMLKDITWSAFQRGPLTPDHLIHTKAKPLFIEDPLFVGPEHKLDKDKVLERLSEYEQNYTEYFNRNKEEGVKMHDPSPRVILMPYIGMITTGKDIKEAMKVSDLYLHTMRVIRDAEAIGKYESLPDEKDVYDMEYWPLELKKLESVEKKELDGKIALVTGGGRGIGKGIVEKLVEEGAHVAVFDKIFPMDLDLEPEFWESGVNYIPTDIADGNSLKESFGEFLGTFGGIDILVNNAGVFRTGKMLDKNEKEFVEDLEESMDVNFMGHAHLSREVAKIMRDQGTGGQIVSVSSKQVPGPGAGFFPYGVSKAALEEMARYHALEFGEYGITSNIVRFGDILETWPKEMKRDRANAHGVSADKLPEFYGNRTTLKKPLTVQDAANFVYNMLRLDNMNGSILHCDNGMKDVWLK